MYAQIPPDTTKYAMYHLLKFLSDTTSAEYEWEIENKSLEYLHILQGRFPEYLWYFNKIIQDNGVPYTSHNSAFLDIYGRQSDPELQRLEVEKNQTIQWREYCQVS